MRSTLHFVESFFYFKQCTVKQLLDSVFVISYWIIKVSAASQTIRLRLIKLASTCSLINLDITKSHPIIVTCLAHQTTGSRGARFEQTFRFSRAIDRDRQPTFVALLAFTHNMYRRTINCGLLNSTRSTYLFLRRTSCLVRKLSEENPKAAWGKRIVAQMKQDRIARHTVTYAKHL